MSREAAIWIRSKSERREQAKTIAGYRAASFARSSDALILVLDGEAAGLDVEGGRWQTLCDDHGFICSHDSLPLAKSWASCPEMFCEPCADHVRSLAALRALDLSGESIPQKGKQA
jgi:hypothetical protein